MGRCLQVTHTFKQAITGGAFEALAAASGDALAVPNFIQGSDGSMLELWAGNSANACEFDVRSPSFHDNVRGLRLALMFNPTLSGADGDPQLLTGQHVRQPLFPSDVLIAEVNGTATNNVALAWISYFEQLPGAEQNLWSWDSIAPAIVNTVGIRVSVTAGAAGDYGANRTLNQDDDRLNANTYYAVLGATSQLPCASLVFVAPETSGRKVGLPLHWDQRISADWFVDLDQKYNCGIPVINSNNKGNVIFQAADPGGAIATAATIQLAELSGQNWTR